MEKNIGTVDKVIRISSRFGAYRFSVCWPTNPLGLDWCASGFDSAIWLVPAV